MKVLTWNYYAVCLLLLVISNLWSGSQSSYSPSGAQSTASGIATSIIDKSSTTPDNGYLSFTQKLFNLSTGKGLNAEIAVTYSNAGVYEAVRKDNVEAPNGVLGLGWNLSLEQIFVEHNGTTSFTDDRWFYQDDRGGVFPLEYCQDKTTLYILNHLNYKVQQIRNFVGTPNERIVGWILIKPDGTKLMFGDYTRDETINGDGHNVNSLSITYAAGGVVDVFSRVIVPIIEYKEYYDRWYLSRVEHYDGKSWFNYDYWNHGNDDGSNGIPMGGSVTLEPIGYPCGLPNNCNSGLNVTKAVYLKEIIANNGDRVCFKYNRSVFNEDPTPFTEPDAYPDRGICRGLTAVSLYLGQSISPYKAWNFTVGSMAETDHYNKDILNSIQLVGADGSALEPSIDFTYEARTGGAEKYFPGYGSIKAIKNQLGSVIEYHYGRNKNVYPIYEDRKASDAGNLSDIKSFGTVPSINPQSELISGAGYLIVNEKHAGQGSGPYFSPKYYVLIDSGYRQVTLYYGRDGNTYGLISNLGVNSQVRAFGDIFAIRNDKKVETFRFKNNEFYKEGEKQLENSQTQIEIKPPYLLLSYTSGATNNRVAEIYYYSKENNDVNPWFSSLVGRIDEGNYTTQFRLVGNSVVIRRGNTLTCRPIQFNNEITRRLEISSFESFLPTDLTTHNDIDCYDLQVEGSRVAVKRYNSTTDRFYYQFYQFNGTGFCITRNSINLDATGKLVLGGKWIGIIDNDNQISFYDWLEREDVYTMADADFTRAAKYMIYGDNFIFSWQSKTAKIGSQYNYEHGAKFVRISHMYASGNSLIAQKLCGSNSVVDGLLNGQDEYSIELNIVNNSIVLKKTHFEPNNTSYDGPNWTKSAISMPTLFSKISVNGFGSFNYGSQLLDINGDGLPDIVENDGVRINNGNGWSEFIHFPGDITLHTEEADYRMTDNGVRLVDLNGDGMVDLLQSGVRFEVKVTEDYQHGDGNQLEKVVTRSAYLFTNDPDHIASHGKIWVHAPNYAPSNLPLFINGKIESIAQGTCSYIKDYALFYDGGARLGDFDGDGLVDVFSNSEGASSQNEKGLWRNTGNGWQRFDINSVGDVPIFITSDGACYSAGTTCNGNHYKIPGYNDNGVRLIDLNGDGRMDFVRAVEGQTAEIYLSKGTSWQRNYTYSFPSGVKFVRLEDFSELLSSSVENRFLHDLVSYSQFQFNNPSGFSDCLEQTIAIDLGTRCVDINADGLTDIITSGGTYINTGTSFEPSSHSGNFIISQWGGVQSETGEQLADLDGDGYVDKSDNQRETGECPLVSVTGSQPYSTGSIMLYTEDGFESCPTSPIPSFAVSVDLKQGYNPDHTCVYCSRGCNATNYCDVCKCPAGRTVEYMGEGTQIADINGDGLADFVYSCKQMANDAWKNEENAEAKYEESFNDACGSVLRVSMNCYGTQCGAQTTQYWVWPPSDATGNEGDHAGVFLNNGTRKSNLYFIHLNMDDLNTEFDKEYVASVITKENESVKATTYIKYDNQPVPNPDASGPENQYYAGDMRYPGGIPVSFSSESNYYSFDWLSGTPRNINKCLINDGGLFTITKSYGNKMYQLSGSNLEDPSLYPFKYLNGLPYSNKTYDQNESENNYQENIWSFYVKKDNLQNDVWPYEYGEQRIVKTIQMADKQKSIDETSFNSDGLPSKKIHTYPDGKVEVTKIIRAWEAEETQSEMHDVNILEEVGSEKHFVDVNNDGERQVGEYMLSDRTVYWNYYTNYTTFWKPILDVNNYYKDPSTANPSYGLFKSYTWGLFGFPILTTEGRDGSDINERKINYYYDNMFGYFLQAIALNADRNQVAVNGFNEDYNNDWFVRPEFLRVNGELKAPYGETIVLEKNGLNLGDDKIVEFDARCYSVSSTGLVKVNFNNNGTLTGTELFYIPKTPQAIGKINRFVRKTKMTGNGIVIEVPPFVIIDNLMIYPDTATVSLTNYDDQTKLPTCKAMSGGHRTYYVYDTDGQLLGQENEYGEMKGRSHIIYSRDVDLINGNYTGACPNKLEKVDFVNGNMIPYWSFEDKGDIATNNPVSYWKTLYDNCSIERSTNRFVYGRYSLHASATTSGLPGVCMEFDPVVGHRQFTGLLGDTATLSFWLYSNVGTCRFGFDGSDMHEVALVQGHWNYVTGTFYNITPVPTNSTYGNNLPPIRLTIEGKNGTSDGNEIYLDGVVLERGERAHHPMANVVFQNTLGKELETQVYDINNDNVLDENDSVSVAYFEYDGLNRLIRKTQPVRIASCVYGDLGYYYYKIGTYITMTGDVQQRFDAVYGATCNPYWSYTYYNDGTDRLKRMSPPGLSSYNTENGGNFEEKYYKYAQSIQAGSTYSPINATSTDDALFNWQISSKVGPNTSRIYNHTLTDSRGKVVLGYVTTDDVDILANSTNLQSIMKFSYDDGGNQVAANLPSNFENVTDVTKCTNVYIGNGSQLTATYDGASRVIQRKLPEASDVTDYWYDKWGRVRFMRDPNNKLKNGNKGAVAYYYDSRGKLGRTALVVFQNDILFNSQEQLDDPLWPQPENVSAYLLLQQNLYDYRGRLSSNSAYSEAAHNDVISVYQYDEDDNITSIVERIPSTKGSVFEQEHRYAYWPGKLVKTYEFIKRSDPAAGFVREMLYDGRGRLAKVLTKGRGAETGLNITEMQYDYNDPRGLVTRAEHPSVSTGAYHIRYAYDVPGRMVELNTDNGFAQYVSYDSPSLTGNSSISLTPQYTGLIAGMRYVGVNPAGNPYGEVFTYHYDDLNRVTETNYSNEAGLAAGFYTNRMAYEIDGNILTNSNDSANVTRAADYVYSPGTNRLEYITGNLRGVYEAGSNVAFEYDANGNMIKDKTKNLEIDYDWRNMPVRFMLRDPQGNIKYVSQMVYDASGNRVAKLEFNQAN